MDEDIDRLLQRLSLPGGHGQEPEAHADVEPLAHADAVEGLWVFLDARSLIFLGLTNSCGGKVSVKLHRLNCGGEDAWKACGLYKTPTFFNFQKARKVPCDLFPLLHH